MKIADLSQADAEEIIEHLRKGVPPRRFASVYSVGTNRFVENVRKRHLPSSPGGGRTRFVSGSWGSGKTHMFRLLAEQAYDAGYLVSVVELSADETPFNKFEKVLAAIAKNISAGPSATSQPATEPIGQFLDDQVERACADHPDRDEAISQLQSELMAEAAIDMDVKRVVRAYWETHKTSMRDSMQAADDRGALTQWFAGEANKSAMHRRFSVQKIPAKENARTLLASLVALIRHLGHTGLLILLDESEMTHSTMRRSNLQVAYNNLLHLLNESGEIPGLVLIYAAVPEFFNDPNTGVGIYGALAARIGAVPDHPPRALDTVWNLDAFEPPAADYCTAAQRVRDVYEKAFPEEVITLYPDQLEAHITQVVQSHSPYHSVSRWRLVMTETVKLLDLVLEGEDLPDPATSYPQTLDTLQQISYDDDSAGWH